MLNLKKMLIINLKVWTQIQFKSICVILQLYTAIIIIY